MGQDISDTNFEYKSVYERVLEFKRKYPTTIAWRLKQNSQVIQQHLNPDEKVVYAFVAQKNNNPFDILSTLSLTAVVAVTTERLLIGRKRVVIGYFFNSVTPDLFNDLKVMDGFLWGKVHLDTVKEYVCLSNIARAALPEIETNISANMMRYKKQKGFRVKE